MRQNTTSVVPGYKISGGLRLLSRWIISQFG